MAFERARLPWLACWLLLTFAGPVWAAPAASESQKEAARNLMAEARELRERQDLSGALSRFEMADAIMGVPTTGYEVAATQAELGQLHEARATLRKLLSSQAKPDEPEPFKAARAKAMALDAELAQRLGAQPEAVPVSAVAAPNDAPMSVAAAAPAAVAAPAPAPAPGKNPTDATPVAPATTSSPIPKLAYVGGGMALAGLVVGSVTGSMALSEKHAAERGCVDNRCPPATWDDLDHASSLATVSTVSFVVAGLGAALGVGALVFGREPDSVKASLTLVARPGQVNVRGRF